MPTLSLYTLNETLIRLPYDGLCRIPANNAAGSDTMRHWLIAGPRTPQMVQANCGQEWVLSASDWRTLRRMAGAILSRATDSYGTTTHAIYTNKASLDEEWARLLWRERHDGAPSPSCNACGHFYDVLDVGLCQTCRTRRATRTAAAPRLPPLPTVATVHRPPHGVPG